MRGTPLRLSDFRGGLNTRDAPYLQEPNQARDLLNVVSTKQGAIRKRDGVATFATPPAELLSLAPCEGTATKFLVGANATNLYSINGAGAVTSIKGALTITNGRWEFTSAPASGGQGPLYGINGTDQAVQWTGAGNAATWTASVGAVPNGRFIKYLANRVIVAGVAASPSRVFAATPGDARNWGTAAGQGWVIDLDPDDGDAITGLGTIGAYLLVFKRDKIFVVYDLETGANRRLAIGTGSTAGRSIVETPQGTVFLTPDKGVWRTDGNRLDRVSELVTPTIANIVTSQVVNACGAFVNDRYYLAFCDSGGSNNKVLDLDLQLGSWWLHTIASNQLVIGHLNTVAEAYSAKAGSAFVDRCFVPGVVQDNGTNYTSTWKGAWLTNKAPFLRKRVRQVHVDGSGSVDLLLTRDFAAADELAKGDLFKTNTTTFGGTGLFGVDGVFGDLTTLQEARKFTPGVGRAWSVGFSKTTNATFEIDSFTVAFTPRTD